jgi:two-component system chemotaxis sensor kinase CheA
MPFDIVVTDIEMPNMNGYELTRQVRADARFSHLPVVAVTSLAGEEDIQRGQEAGVNCYQIKLDREELVSTVQELISGAAAMA